MFARIETKPWAALAGFLGGGGFGMFVVWLLGVLLWHQSYLGQNADAAIAAVPWPVAQLVPLALAAVTGVTAAYQAAPSNHAGNNATGEPMDDTDAGHLVPDPTGPTAEAFAQPDGGPDQL